MQKWIVILMVSMGLVACHSEKQEETVELASENIMQNQVDSASDFEHTSENSVDFVGIYLTQSPDLTASLDLNGDGSYHFKGNRYKDGKEEQFSYEGQYKWLADGVRIQLGEEAKNVQFFIGENAIWYLGDNPDNKNTYVDIQNNPEFMKEID